MRMTKDGTIKSEWKGWADEDKCPLCSREGKGIANVWKKGHRRENGIILETGISYCEECAHTSACERHWKKWWAEQWGEQEQRYEENWEKYGVYTNVGGYFGMPSFYFGYAKTREGLQPYLQVYPDCPRYKLEKEVQSIKHQYEKLGSAECRRHIAELVEVAEIDQEYKDRIIIDINNSFDRMDEWTREQKKCMYCDNMAFTYYCKKVWYEQPNEQGETFGVVCDACNQNQPLNYDRPCFSYLKKVKYLDE